MQYSEEFKEKLGACREIYLKHGGKNHELIEKEMRDLGYRDFHRRNLYRRFERGSCTPGWVETYGWNSLLKMQSAKCKVQNEEPAGGNASVNERADHNDSFQENQNNSITQTPHSALRTPHLEEFEEFKQWLKATWPNKQWDWKHQVYIYKHLKRVWDGDCDRLMIFLPPRHGKSELVTVRFPAWALKHKPDTKVIIGSYNQKLANNFSRKVRDALAEDAFVSEPPASAGGQSDSKKSGNKNKTDV